MDFAVVSLEMRSLGDERIFPGDTIMRKCKNAEGIQSMTLWKLGWDHLKGTKDVLFPVSVLLLAWIPLRFTQGVVLGRAPLNVPFPFLPDHNDGVICSPAAWQKRHPSSMVPWLFDLGQDQRHIVKS